MNHSNHTPTTLRLERWEILDVASGEGIPEQLANGGGNWIPCSAPGDTYLALHQAGRLPHPMADENESACSWVRDREWWWRTSFSCDAAAANERVLLTFEGLDTYATVWLDGEQVASSRNMFTPLTLDISKYLETGKTHILLLKFTPPSLNAPQKSMPIWPFISDPIKASKRNYHRKAQFGWGWDWGPDLPTVGIWKPVQLQRQRVAAIKDVHFTTLEIGPVARVDVALTVDAFAHTSDSPLSATIRMLAPSGECAASTSLPLIAGLATSHVILEIINPQLWWTPELGAASLYTLEVELHDGKQALDSSAQQVGIRHIALDTSADPEEPGCDFFRFVLNGVPLFARGVNWIPASSFVGALTTSDYDKLLESAAAANMNMIRVWGGGLYEDQSFYKTCDRLGILVWQDFMFACAPYPEHEATLVSSVREEVDSQILRLRNHPCIALWCGNNEGQAVHALVDRLSGTKTPYPGDLFFEKIIPEALTQLDPSTPYRAGSPYGGPSHNSMRAGDVHNWTVWHGLPPVPDDLPIGGFDHSPAAVAYTRYAEDKARFVSEFGIQAAPARSTLEKWMGPEKLSLTSSAFLNRIKDKPKDKVNAMLLPVTGLPENLDQYIEYTQLVQAEGLKFGIEHYRRRKPHCSGTLIWQYNDCWPGISWSLIDSENVPKASWYYVARAYAPVMASFKKLDSGDVELWVSNDTLSEVHVDAVLLMMSLAGETLWTEQVIGTVAANVSVVVWRGDAQKIAAAPHRVLAVRAKNLAGNQLLFAPFKDLILPSSEPEMHIRSLEDGSLQVTLKGTGFHPFVRLQAQDPKARFSDNYFDLIAGETRVINVRAQHALTIAQLRVETYRPRTVA